MIAGIGRLLGNQERLRTTANAELHGVLRSLISTRTSEFGSLLLGFLPGHFEHHAAIRLASLLSLLHEA
jgi:hypothetical protein